MTSDREIQLTLTDVAQLAGVGPSAVSNWKNRWPDFPTATSSGTYLQTEVEAWLRLHDKDVRTLKRPAPSTLLWKAADTLRSAVPVEDTLELILQLLALKAASRGRIERFESAGQWWSHVSTDPRQSVGSELWRIAGEIGQTDHDLGPVFEPSSSARRLTVSEIRSLFRALDDLPSDSDWGRLATSVLTEFPERFGLRAAEQVTPSALADMITGLLQPIRGRVYDPACGVGVLLARAWSGRERRDGISLHGQDINAQAQRLARLHLLVNDAPFEGALGDTLLDDRLWDLRADRIVAQPPLNERISFSESLRFDPRWEWGVPSSSADWLWVQHVAFHLAADGIGVVTVGSGALFRGGSETAIRRRLLESDLLDAVIQLPPAMIPSTSVPLTLLVLQRGRREREGRVLFVDAGKAGSRERGGLRRFRNGEIAEILAPVGAWREGGDPTRPGLAGVATVQELLASDAVLSPARYVAYPVGQEGEPIPARYRRLSAAANRGLGDLENVVEVIHRELADIEVVE
jgi:type I restriction-modification system DNA methylase subunit